MSTVLRVCRKCGAEVFTDAPEGLCTACLFETGLDLLAHESVAGIVDPSLGDGLPLAAQKKKPNQQKTVAKFGDYELLEEIGRGGQGEQYDRDLNDLFAIQSEIAQKIAGQLCAKISPTEKLAIERKPTDDLVAFELYSRAMSLTPTYRGGTADSGQQAIDLLNQAVARDPSFLEAYCSLAQHHDQLYFFGFDHTPTRLAAAEAAIQEAFRIRPNAGEAHLARAFHLYNGYLDYDGA